MKRSHEEKSWRRIMKKSYDRKTWRLFDRESVTVLACVTRKVLGKEVLGHLGGVEQYYRWW